MKKLYTAVIMLMIALSGVCYASDIDNHWSKEYFIELANLQIFSGSGDGNFMPDREITRAEFVTAAIRSINEPARGGIISKFSDVSDSDFYAPYIHRAYELGIVSGFPDGSFRPYAPLTREEAVVILSRTFGFLSGYSITGVFSDADKINPATQSAFSYAYRKGIISGYSDNTVRPKGHLTRAEAAVMLSRSLLLDGNEPGFVVGYPRLAATGAYGCIRLEISTNMPCIIYYALHPSDTIGIPARSNINKPLTTTPSATKQVSADIVCDVGNEYDIFLMATTADGRYSRIVKIENTAALPFSEGDGTKGSPYCIYNQLQLDAIRYAPDKEFVLKDNITLSGEWRPIENFDGVLNGAGHRINGLLIKSDENCAGLFRRIGKGKISNLTIDGNVRAKNNAGIFAGELISGELSGCVATGQVEAISNNAGGLCGESSGRIKGSLSAVYLVEAGAFSGGVVGQNYGIITQTISAVHTVAADMYAGGISSINMGGKIERCISACTNIFDIMMDNCGRITVNKKNGITKENYAYDKTKTTSSHAVNEADNHNGADISWEKLLDTKLCTQLMGGDCRWSGGGRAERYLLPYPAGAAMPVQLAGAGPYTPIRISTAAELLGMIDNPDMHFLLVKDIRFDNNTVWSTAADTTDPEKGFCGTLDGGGHTIFGLTLTPGENGNSGLFGMISSGTVRNVIISGAVLSGDKNSGVIAAVSYGTIENCNVDATINAESYIGGIAGYNYGQIINSQARIKLNSTDSNSVTSGGIAAHNEGFIDDCAFIGNMTIHSDESVAGGICGYNSGGMIYNSYANLILHQQAKTLYSGGICGIQDSGEIYKCSSLGTLNAERTQKLSTSYSGGICGLIAGGLVMHSFSAADISSYTIKSYSGGICGYIENALVQNVYAANSVVNVAEPGDYVMSAYAGGLCGRIEEGILGSAVSANPAVISSGLVSNVCPDGVPEDIYDCYALDNMQLKGEGGNLGNGINISAAKLSRIEFFTKSLSDGGTLGWSEDIWQKSNSDYRLPILKDVKYQTSFSEKRP